MRYEYFDRNKDFQKEPYDSLPKHNIYALSDEGLNKYLNQRKYTLEIERSYSRNKDEQINKNNIEENNKKSSFQYSLNNPQSINQNFNSLTFDNNIDNNNNYNKYNKDLKYNTHRRGISLNFTNKIYFKPIIIGKTLKNKYLIKQKHKPITYNLFGEKLNLKSNELPIVEYNKAVGHRKIQLKKINAYVTSSTFSNKYTNHKSYYMGENYNPSNYMLDNSKNRTKRNEFGSLFVN